MLPSFLPSFLLILVVGLGTTAPRAAFSEEIPSDADGDGLPDAVPTATPVVGEETRYHPGNLPNFDLRYTDPELRALAASAISPDDALEQELAARRFEADNFEAGVSVSLDPFLHTPSFVIGTRGAFMTAPSFDTEPDELIGELVREHPDLFQISDWSMTDLAMTHERTSPINGVRTITWQQRVDGLPILGAVLRVGLNRFHELFMIGSRVLPTRSDWTRWDAQCLPAEAAVSRAIEFDDLPIETTLTADPSMLLETSARFENASGWSASAGKAYLPLSRTEIVPVWRVSVTKFRGRVSVSYVVDGRDGRILSRTNHVANAAEEATFEVFRNTAAGTAPYQPADSPMPLSPGWPGPGAPSPALTPIARVLETLVALDSPDSSTPSELSPNGWVEPGQTGYPQLIGNNVSLVFPDPVPVAGFFPPSYVEDVSDTRTFSFPLDLQEEPGTTDAFRAIAVQAFYTFNWAHDRFYQLGFDEGLHCSQRIDYGPDRADPGDDDAPTSRRIEVVLNPFDCISRFGPQADNSSGTTDADLRSTIYLPYMVGPNVDPDTGLLQASPAEPGRATGLDAELALHEYGHVVVYRIDWVNNGSTGPVSMDKRQFRGMFEGWSDFFALSLLSEPYASAPYGALDAAETARLPHAFGAYSAYRSKFPTNSVLTYTDGNSQVYLYNCQGENDESPHNPMAHWNENHYFGFRRYPYAADLDVNPLTFDDISTETFSVPPGVPSTSHPYLGPILALYPETVPHNVGEVWASCLWECRARLIEKYGFAGNEFMLYNVVEGLTQMPANPSLLDARDAILAADVQNALANLTIDGVTMTSNRCELWQAFAARGMGDGADSSSGVEVDIRDVVESYQTPSDCYGDLNHADPSWESYP